jgi:hypothetical protein
MQDAAFLAEVDRLKLSVSAAEVEEVQKAMVQMYASPKEVVQRAREAIRP